MKHILLAAALLTPVSASTTTLCDPAYENCRVQLTALINQERVGIDAFVWFMEDYRYVAALTRARDRGVRVRILANDRWSDIRGAVLRAMRTNNLPVRVKATSGMAHTKAMIFHGQMVVEHGGANFTPPAFVPRIPYVNYTDEAIQFNTDPAVVQSYMTTFDDLWTSRHFKNYSNALSPQRAYPPLARDARVQVSTPENPHEFHQRMVALVDAEQVGINVIMYRISSSAIVNAVLRAHARGVLVRILTEPASMTWRTHPVYERQLRAAGIQVKRRVHAGLTHEKFSSFASQGITVIGSQNWTSTEYAIEHNLFDTDPLTFAWAQTHFERKWHALQEFR